MATISASSTINIQAAGAVATESVSIQVLPMAGASLGKGRLYHPTLGVLDYPHAPDRWKNVDTDVIAPPPWASTPTLGGAANTIWPASIMDVDIMEQWDSDISVPMTFLRQLLNFRINPPAPEDGYIEWYPTYVNGYGYKVVLYDVTCGGEQVTLDYVSRQGWVSGALTIRMKVVGRV